MFIKVRRTLIALALVAASSLAAKVAYATDSGGGNCSSGVSISPSSTSGVGSVGSPMNLSGPMPNGFSGAVSYSVAGVPLPAGLILNSSTGAVTGIPQASSTATVIISVAYGAQSCQFEIVFAITGGSTPCVAGVPTSTSSLVSFDSTFASDGAYDFSGQLASSSYTGAAAGPNGSLYVAASEGTEYSQTPTNSLTHVYRFLANGTLDSTWGNSGVASIDISALATNSERPSDVLVLSDGSVVVGISSTTYGSSMTVELKLAKLTSAGALDATFGTNGLANIASGSTSIMMRTFVEGPARTIYVGKSTMTGNYPNMVTTYGVIKLSALGVVDSAFGTNGELATSSDVMTTDSTGALYVGGLTSSTPADAKIVKYLPSGSIDTSFGASGEKVLSTSSGSGAESLSALVVANGKLSGVVGARGAIVNNFPTYETSLFRMNTSGVLDASFGSGGIALLGTVGNSIRDITVLSDGSAILSVWIFGSGPPSWGFTAMTADGTPVASLVTSLADLKSGTCKLSDAAVVVTSAGLFVAGLAFPAGEGSPTTHIFKIALADFATGGSGGSGGESTTTTTTPSSSATTTTTSTTVPPPAESVVLGLPRAGTPLVADDSYAPGDDVTLTFSGFEPGEFVQLIVASTPQVISSGYANSQGVVTLSGKMPADLVAGNHTLAVYAPGRGVGFSQPITVTALLLPATGWSGAGLLYGWAMLIILLGVIWHFIGRRRNTVNN